jgi:hypothetical protein
MLVRWILLNWRHLLIIVLLVSGFCMYWFAVTPLHSSIPPDSIYLAVGPPLKEGELIGMDQFRFEARITSNTINIDGTVEFFTQSRAHFFDFYLPFVVTNSTAESRTMSIRTEIYRDAVDERCSLVHVNMTSDEGLHMFNVTISVKELVAMSSIGEDRIILTFGYPGMSARFRSLDRFFEQATTDISDLIPITVTIIVDEPYFFTSNTYPPPEVEYLTSDERIATWLLEFSGPLGNYYRSIDCTTRREDYFQARQFLLFFSGVIVSLGASALVILRGSPYLWYRRIRRMVLKIIGR